MLFCGQRAPLSACRSRVGGGRQERGSCAPQPDAVEVVQSSIPPETCGSNPPAKHKPNAPVSNKSIKHTEIFPYLAF